MFLRKKRKRRRKKRRIGRRKRGVGEGGRAEKRIAEGKTFCRTVFKEHPEPIYTNILALNLSVWRGEAENERK